MSFPLDCMLNCSNHGVCSSSDNTCECSEGYTGTGCQVSMCPADCNSDLGNGVCRHSPPSSPLQHFCLCEPGYYGDRCSLASENNSLLSRDDGSNDILSRQDPYVDYDGDKWHWLWEGHPFDELFTPRTSHGTVFISSLNKVYIFGGYDLNNILGDLLVYDFDNGAWLKVGDPDSKKLVKERNASRKLAHLMRFSSSFDPLTKRSDRLTGDSSRRFPLEQYPHTFPVKVTSSGNSRVGPHDTAEFTPASGVDSLPVGSLILGTTLQPQNFTFTVNTKNTVSVTLKQATDAEDDSHHRKKVFGSALGDQSISRRTVKPASTNPVALADTDAVLQETSSNDHQITDFSLAGSLKVKRDIDEDVNPAGQSNKVNFAPADGEVVMLVSNKENNDRPRAPLEDGSASRSRSPFITSAENQELGAVPQDFEPVIINKLISQFNKNEHEELLVSQLKMKEKVKRRLKSRPRRMVPPGSDLHRAAQTKT